MKISSSTPPVDASTIEAEAARLYRQHGIDAVSVRDVMGAVGMTHGGFYKHYASKAELVNLSLMKAFRETENVRKTWREEISQGQHAFDHYVAQYLSIGHRNNPGTGCPIAGLSTDLSRVENNEELKNIYGQGLENFISEIQDLINKNCSQTSSHLPKVITAMLVGAIIISRATQGLYLSTDILESVKIFVNDLQFKS